MPTLPKRDENKLTVKDVASGDLIVINNAGEIINFEKKDAKGNITDVDSKLKLEFTLPDGRKKKWALNHKSYKNLSKMWGDNSDGWVGKSAMVAIEESAAYGEYIVLFPTKSPTKREDGLEEVPF